MGHDNLDYDQLLDGCSEIGVQLVRFGGEIQRAEDTVRRLFAAYGLEGEVFAVPNCVWASVRTPDGRIHARMRRVPSITNNIEGIERLNDLSRRLCAKPPADPALLREYCRETVEGLPSYPAALVLGGYFFGAFSFALFFPAAGRRRPRRGWQGWRLGRYCCCLAGRGPMPL